MQIPILIVGGGPAGLWRSTGAAADAISTLELVVSQVLGFAGHERRQHVVMVNASAGRRCA